MAFQLSMTEVDLARGIAERALKQINYREFDEKLNVWLAYINLEYKYGDEKSFEHVFKEGYGSERRSCRFSACSHNFV